MMRRKIFFLGTIFTLLFACNDGDLEVETISFENSDLLSCTSDISAEFLFKYNGKQAMILELPSEVLKNEADTLVGTIPSSYKLFYRNFNETVSTAYFCSTYPPASPAVVSQFEATGGTVTIITKPIYSESTNELLRYDHLISIKDLVILNSDGAKIVDSDFVFGTYQTTE